MINLDREFRVKLFQVLKTYKNVVKEHVTDNAIKEFMQLFLDFENICELNQAGKLTDKETIHTLKLKSELFENSDPPKDSVIIDVKDQKYCFFEI